MYKILICSPKSMDKIISYWYIAGLGASTTYLVHCRNHRYVINICIAKLLNLNQLISIVVFLPHYIWYIVVHWLIC